MYLVVLDGFETVPEIAGIADEVPTNLLAVQVVGCQQFIIAFLHGFEFFLGRLFAVRERKNGGDFSCHIFEEGSIELSVDIVLLLEFLCVSH